MTRTARLRSVLVAAALVLAAGGFAVAPAAHASGCPDGDNPCDPMPQPLPRVPVPTVTFGCGTVTVREGNVSKTLHILPCPGPVIVSPNG